jgi:hypothetical protein
VFAKITGGLAISPKLEGYYPYVASDSFKLLLRCTKGYVHDNTSSNLELKMTATTFLAPLFSLFIIAQLTAVILSLPPYFCISSIVHSAATVNG